MKLQLDTKEKTIKLESDVKFSELISTLEKLLPKGEWKEFKLETNVTINTWRNPIIIRDYTRPYPSYPWVTYSSNSNKRLCDYSLKAGTYNIEL